MKRSSDDLTFYDLLRAVAIRSNVARGPAEAEEMMELVDRLEKLNVFGNVVGDVKVTRTVRYDET